MFNYGEVKKESYKLELHGIDLYGRGEKGDGVCKCCGKWTAHLKHDGTCREKECIEGRIAIARAKGQVKEIHTPKGLFTICFGLDEIELPTNPKNDPNVVKRDRVTEDPKCKVCGKEWAVRGGMCLRCRQKTEYEKYQERKAEWKARKVERTKEENESTKVVEVKQTEHAKQFKQSKVRSRGLRGSRLWIRADSLCGNVGEAKVRNGFGLVEEQLSERVENVRESAYSDFKSVGNRIKGLCKLKS